MEGFRVMDARPPRMDRRFLDGDGFVPAELSLRVGPSAVAESAAPKLVGVFEDDDDRGPGKEEGLWDMDDDDDDRRWREDIASSSSPFSSSSLSCCCPSESSSSPAARLGLVTIVAPSSESEDLREDGEVSSGVVLVVILETVERRRVASDVATE